MIYMFLPMDRDDFCPTGRYYHADPSFHSESEATRSETSGIWDTTCDTLP